MHGGNQPVTGATIQLYAVGTGGYGSASTPLLTGAPITTDSTGSFSVSFTGDNCPSADTQVYLTATDGNPGLTSGTNNTALALMAALGSCGNLSANIIINEVTTVAAVWALQQFISDYADIGASSTNTAGLAGAFANVATIVGSACGCALQAVANAQTVPYYNLPQSTIDTLANALADCVNSDGSTSTGKPCATLFSDATPSGGKAPANTLAAALDIAQNPANNVAAIYSLSTATAAFQPTLSAQPNDWTMTMSTYGTLGEGLRGTLTSATGQFCFFYIVESGQTVGCEAGGSVIGIPFLAYDAADFLWVEAGLQDGSTEFTHPASFAISDADLPDIGGLSFDSSGNVWSAANSGTYIFSPTGTLLLSSPVEAAAYPDASGGMWGYGSGSTLQRNVYDGSAITTTTYTGAVTTNPLGFEMDGSENIWVLNGNSTLSRFTPSGSTVTTTTATGGGLNTSAGGSFAIDGEGNVWVANKSATYVNNNAAITGLSEFSNAGTALSPAGGWNPYASGNIAAYFGIAPIQSPSALSIDTSGDVTVLTAFFNSFYSYGPNPYEETTMIGVAAPVVDSPAWDAANNKFGTRP